MKEKIKTHEIEPMEQKFEPTNHATKSSNFVKLSYGTAAAATAGKPMNFSLQKSNETRQDMKPINKN